MCRIFHSVLAGAKGAARRGSAFLLAAAVAAGAASSTALAENTWEISDGDTIIYHTTAASDPAEVLEEAGLELEETDQISSSTYGDFARIVISRSQAVTISCDGAVQTAQTCAQTVQELLSELDITLTGSDRCSVPLDAELREGMYIEITRVTEEICVTEEAIAATVEYYEAASLAAGESRVLREGTDGTVQYSWQVTYENGVEVSRQLLGSEVLCEPVSEIVLTSTDRSMHEHDGTEAETAVLSYEAASDASSVLPQDDAASVSSSTLPQDDSSLVAAEDKSSAAIAAEAAASTAATSGTTTAAETTAETQNTLTTAAGETLTYTQVLTCTATAYTGGGSTASGTSARVGAVAVDPDVIPLGTVLYIVTNDGYCVYGVCVAEDTGSAISGYRVDLYFNTYSECVNFGQRTVTVYVLQTEDTTEETTSETAAAAS